MDMGSMDMGMSMGMSDMSMTSTAATVTRNIDASSWGGEATLAASLTPQLKLDTSLAYVRGHSRTDNLPLAQLPRSKRASACRSTAGRSAASGAWWPRSSTLPSTRATSSDKTSGRRRGSRCSR